ncbi:FKBP-type peptidyl-prolyl cis-trans isomerase FklB [Pedobacter cryoconitis]|uniref:Peptidyl-prolyl cis-trans isomerase n=1 Tax=Pedobacter cryoconitis TaxID=188932 RepID=A0A7W8YR01_9SPHI|nr:FKBP-type peptidyl-prolyl cis-trans isomerase [Pedobacter cryoconitis]MBB5619905.1 FKBP-type peptidyl-prolyl cis-trans isomerase FklB [Pedobacter cryoconitis]MBB5648051.1 FKBP-type peptidyl-prolyl cis-trans isomerase FklB [Pedobacter cryoconitis]
MKKLIITLLIPFCGYAVTAQTKRKPATKKALVKSTAAPARMTSLADSASYAFGISMGSGLKTNGLKALNYDLLIKGLKDAFQGQTPLLNEQASQKAIGDLFKTITMEKYAPQIAKEKNFLEGNLKQINVKNTASGLQYIVITPGEGPKPTATDNVLVNYKGTLLDGKQFDSSYDRKEPLSIAVNRVIPGWTEGLQLMSPGSKYKFFIPYQLAYGERAMGKDIPPYSMLIFEVELLKINGK